MQAVVLRPFQAEVLDAVVTCVEKYGVFCQAGPLGIFVFEQEMPGFRFDATTVPPSWVGEDDVRIRDNTELRLRILGVQTDATRLSALGSIADPAGFLGPPGSDEVMV